MKISEQMSTISSYALYASMTAVLTLPRTVAIVGVLATSVLSIASGRMRWLGLSELTCYVGLLASVFYFENVYAKFGFGSLALLLNVAISLHKLPGFNNEQVISNKVISKGAVPYSLYVNYDKSLAGAITLIAFGLHTPIMPRQSISNIVATVFLMSLATISTVLLGASALRYVKPEFKIKPHFKRWVATNFLLVCPAEEALFRTQIQDRLLQNCSPQFALLLSAVLFGCTHFQGGIKYMGLASLAGLGYGLTYQLTGDIRSSIALHFILNLTHFVGFTYPALKSSVGYQNTLQ